MSIMIIKHVICSCFFLFFFSEIMLYNHLRTINKSGTGSIHGFVVQSMTLKFLQENEMS